MCLSWLVPLDIPCFVNIAIVDTLEKVHCALGLVTCDEDDTDYLPPVKSLFRVRSDNDNIDSYPFNILYKCV